MERNANALRTLSRTNTTPLAPDRSTKQIDVSVGTSVPAGRMTPVMAYPLLREDTLKTSDLFVKVDLMEAAEAVRNPIDVRFLAYFVPFLAFAKFDGGRDEFDRSYMKAAGANGQPVTPFFETANLGADGSVPILRYLGLHNPLNFAGNDAYIRAYNIIWNFRARNRSKQLFAAKARLETNTALAPAFWNHEQFKYVVPDWDDQAMEGSVDLTFTSALIPVIGNGPLQVENTANTMGTRTVSALATSNNLNASGSALASNNTVQLARAASGVVADLAQSGVKISLANIQAMEKARWYAEAKAQFEGLTQGTVPDNVAIDLLMQGISVPDKMWQQPILVADKTVVANLDKRWATDGANLASAMVNGEASTMLRMTMPRCPTGGIIMVVAEILPRQFFERMEDPLLFTTDVATLPRADRDDMDAQPVERVSNRMIDVSHTNGSGLFGYAPLHHKWQQPYARLGGKFFKSSPSNTFNQDRAQFWTVEQQDPQYNADFMISENMNQLPFVLLNVDVGEAEMMGSLVIEGNTQFGERLIENEDAYNEVRAVADQTRIVKGV